MTFLNHSSIQWQLIHLYLLKFLCDIDIDNNFTLYNNDKKIIIPYNKLRELWEQFIETYFTIMYRMIKVDILDALYSSWYLKVNNFSKLWTIYILPVLVQEISNLLLFCIIGIDGCYEYLNKNIGCPFNKVKFKFKFLFLFQN